MLVAMIAYTSRRGQIWGSGEFGVYIDDSGIQ